MDRPLDENLARTTPKIRPPLAEILEGMFALLNLAVLLGAPSGVGYAWWKEWMPSEVLGFLLMPSLVLFMGHGAALRSIWYWHKASIQYEKTGQAAIFYENRGRHFEDSYTILALMYFVFFTLFFYFASKQGYWMRIGVVFSIGSLFWGQYFYLRDLKRRSEEVLSKGKEEFKML